MAQNDDQTQAVIDKVNKDLLTVKKQLEHAEEVLEQSMNPQEELENNPGESLPDPRYDEAVILVMNAGNASVTLLKEKMKIGDIRAGRLLDRMEAEGLIGPEEGTMARKILKK